MQYSIFASFAILGVISLLTLMQSYAVEPCKGLARVGDRVGIKYQITNNLTVKEPYVTIVQIKDSEGITIELSWLQGVLDPEQKMDVIQSWIPENVGQYTAEVFMWESVDAPIALSPVRTLEINVNC